MGLDDESAGNDALEEEGLGFLMLNFDFFMRQTLRENALRFVVEREKRFAFFLLFRLNI